MRAGSNARAARLVAGRTVLVPAGGLTGKQASRDPQLVAYGVT